MSIKTDDKSAKGWCSAFDENDTLKWCGIIWDEKDDVLTIETIPYILALTIWGAGRKISASRKAIYLENITELPKDTEGLKVYTNQLSCMRDFDCFNKGYKQNGEKRWQMSNG